MAASPNEATHFEALLQENRVIDAPPEFKAPPSSPTHRCTRGGDRDPEAFWESFARELEWSTPWTRVLEWTPPSQVVRRREDQCERQLPRSSRPHGPTEQGRARLGRASRAIAGR